MQLFGSGGELSLGCPIRRPATKGEVRAVLRGDTVVKFITRTGLAAAATIGSVLLEPATALGQASKQEYPIPRNPSEDLTAIERIFTPPKPPPLTAFPEIRERWHDTPAFLRDSKFSIDARSYFRDAVNAPGSTNIEQAWASGGSISAETGRLFDLVTLGAVLYTSFPVVAPPQYGNTEILLRDQQGYAASSTPACICSTRTRSRSADTSTTRPSSARTTTACRPTPSPATR